MKWIVAVLVVAALVIGVALTVSYGQATQAVVKEPRTTQLESSPRLSATRTNNDGPVAIAVTPLYLGSGLDTVDFSVEMNTHSVDLGFDLSKMSVLRTDSGVEIAPSAYKGGSGHHVTGELVFPAAGVAGAKSVTLIIRDVAGVPERAFTWELK